MGSARPTLFAFNRGMISKRGLARVTEGDPVAGRVRLSAEVQTNYIPRVLGSMMLRPGLQYISTLKSSSRGYFAPFIYGTNDLANLEITDQNLRVLIDDAPISRPSVSATITNGEFTSDLTGWADVDETGAASSWDSGSMALLGTGVNSAIRRQQVTVTETGTLHGLRIVIGRGPVRINVGTTSGNDDYFTEVLGTGTHSLAFTPTGNFWLEFESPQSYTTLVDSVAIESSGTQDLPAPWLEADLKSIRWVQSADVIYLACPGYQQRRVERRGTTSWSIVLYEPLDGPFRVINTTSTTIAPSAISGDVTLTASSPIFTDGNVGSLYKVESIGQIVSTTLTAENQFTDSIRVTGVDNSRIFDIDVDVDGSWGSGVVTIQRSVGEEGNWQDVSALTYTSDTTTTHDDGFDNQIIYYRIGVKTGDYDAGSADVELSYGSGSNTGIARITSVTSTTTAEAVVLNAFGGTDASTNWYESEWSERRGYSSAVELPDGRLMWAGKSKYQLSVSDAYDSFDDTVEGDSGPINKSIGKGPVDNINWIFDGQRLVIGTDGQEVSVKSSSFDDPITPTQIQTKAPTTLGSANVPIAKIDSTGIFVHRGQSELYRLVYNDAIYDYTAAGLLTLIPELGEESPLVRVAVQRQPDTRIHVVREDGKVAIMISEPSEDVSCWILFETDGVVEDVFVMPGLAEDRVYYVVKRTIDGNTVRYLEKWALESECVGGTLNKQADSFITYTGSSTDTITGLDHLEGEEVVVWADGKDLSDGFNDDQVTYTVTSGSITLPEAVTNAVVGLPYKAQYKSCKLAYGAQGGSSLSQVKRVDHVAPIMANTHHKGLQYGSDFETLYDLPNVENGVVVPTDTIHSVYDEVRIPFDGIYDTDSRICLQSQAPRPCNLLAISADMQTYEQ